MVLLAFRAESKLRERALCRSLWALALSLFCRHIISTAQTRMLLPNNDTAALDITTGP